MDEADPQVDDKLRLILQQETEKYQMQFHHLRHRNAGNKLLIEFHLSFHQDITIAKAHELATAIEEKIKESFPMETEIISHFEPIDAANC